MNERATVIGATTVAVVALGGLFVLARRHDSLAPKVGRVRIVPGPQGLPDYVEIAIDPSPALRRLAEAEDSDCEYRVRDAEGLEYPLMPSADEKARSLRVLYAYGRVPIRPVIEVWTNGERRAAVPVPLPPPLSSLLEAQKDAPIRAFHLTATDLRPTKGRDYDLRGGIRFAPSAPILSDERWRIAVLGTSIQKRFPRILSGDGQAVYANHPPPYGLPPAAVARLFYAEDVTSVRVRVERLLHRTESQRVRLTGLRLVKKNGQTALAWSGTEVPNALGLKISRVPQDLGYVKYAPGSVPSTEVADSDGDLRHPVFDLRNDTVLSPAQGARGPGVVSSSDPYAADHVRFMADVQGIERLNIHRFGFGDFQWTASGPVRGPVYAKPFDVTLTITKEWDETLGTFEAIIPVEPFR